YEFVQSGWGGLFEFGISDRVVFNDVHLAWYYTTELFQFHRIGDVIIKIFEDDVLIRHARPGLFMKISQSLGKRFQGILLVDRHDLVPLLVIGGMERKCKVEFH